MAEQTSLRSETSGRRSRSERRGLPIGAVVLAAGLSRRMGKEKVLLPFGQATVLERILATLAAAGVSERVVVLRPDLPQAVGIVQRAGARVVVNPHPEEEMLLSIRLGMADLPEGLDGFFVWPADHPAVEAETLEVLSREGSPSRVAVATYETRRGHPALVGAGLKTDIGAIPAGQGLHHLWRLRPEVLLEVAVPDRGVILDLDTPEDYDRAIASLSLPPGEGRG